jgi:hypothetical protein
LYHSTTALTTNGTVLVAGCDRCGKVVTNLTFAPSPAKAEYRSEIFYPPFWYDMDKKPQILDAPSEVEYGEEFTVSFSALTGANPNVTVSIMINSYALRVKDYHNRSIASQKSPLQH